MMDNKGTCSSGAKRMPDNTSTANIHEHMDVIASCGTKIGVVDHVEGNAIKLTRKDSPDGQHHFLPFSMVDHVDQQVHLNKNSEEARREWKSDSSSCCCGG